MCKCFEKFKKMVERCKKQKSLLSLTIKCDKCKSEFIFKKNKKIGGEKR